MIQSTTNLKKSMGRERRRWRTHQNEEERLNSTRKPRRRATAISRVSNLLRSVSRDLARDLDGKSSEGTRGYTFIDPIRRFRVENPGFLGGFGWGGFVSGSVMARGRRARLIGGVHSSAKQGRERAAATAPGPAHASAREKGRNGLGSDGPTENASPNKIQIFWNPKPNKIKTTPYNKINATTWMHHQYST
jgi:hypothetical protein